MQELNRVPDWSKVYEVSALITYQGRLFAMRHSSSHSSRPNTWGPPSSPLFMAETLHEGLVRTVKDQTGWDLERVIECAHETEWVSDGVTHHEFFFVVTLSKYPNPALIPGAAEYAWTTRTRILELADTAFPLVRDFRKAYAAALPLAFSPV
jgi:ADP-ribose pyrophosphatase YjhB (NUDIX family)